MSQICRDISARPQWLCLNTGREKSYAVYILSFDNVLCINEMKVRWAIYSGHKGPNYAFVTELGKLDNRINLITLIVFGLT